MATFSGPSHSGDRRMGTSPPLPTLHIPSTPSESRPRRVRRLNSKGLPSRIVAAVVINYLVNLCSLITTSSDHLVSANQLGGSWSRRQDKQRRRRRLRTRCRGRRRGCGIGRGYPPTQPTRESGGRSGGASYGPLAGSFEKRFYCFLSVSERLSLQRLLKINVVHSRPLVEKTGLD